MCTNATRRQNTRIRQNDRPSHVRRSRKSGASCGAGGRKPGRLADATARHSTSPTRPGIARNRTPAPEGIGGRSAPRPYDPGAAQITFRHQGGGIVPSPAAWEGRCGGPVVRGAREVGSDARRPSVRVARRRRAHCASETHNWPRVRVREGFWSLLWVAGSLRGEPGEKNLDTGRAGVRRKEGRKVRTRRRSTASGRGGAQR